MVDLDDQQVLFAVRATYAVGARAIAEASRVDGLHMIIPDVEATFTFELDGVTFRVAISVEEDGG